MKFLEFNARTIKIMKIIEFNCLIKENNETNRIPFGNQKHNENQRIPTENQEKS